MKNYEVFLSLVADYKLEKLLEYIALGWGEKAKNDFLKKFVRHVKKVSTNPESCIRSTEFEGLYKCVVTKQTSFYYRIIPEAIEIITIVDNRQDPDKTFDEIKKLFD